MTTEAEIKTREAILRLAREHAGRSDRHATGEELVGYLERRLDPETVDRLRDHLVICAECRGLLGDVTEGLTPREVSSGQLGATEVVDFEAERAFRAAWRRLAEAESPADRVSRAGGWRVIAAILAFACVGLSGWVLELRGTVAELSGPRLNLGLIDLFPAETSVRGTPNASARESVIEGREVVLIFHLRETAELDDLIVRAFDAQERELWRSGGLDPGPARIATVVLPAALLAEGEVHFRVESSENGAADVYVLETEAP